jgi:hypothetical protein
MFDNETEHFTYTRIVQTPTDEPVERLVATQGNWNGTRDYIYVETTPEGRYSYALVTKDSNTIKGWSEQYDIKYDPIDGKFHDVGTDIPYTWGIDDIGTNLSAFPTNTNMATHYFYNDDDSLMFEFDNPYYVAPPPEPVDEPEESKKRLVATGGNWNNGFDYYYFETTPKGRFLYGRVNKGYTDRLDGSNEWDVEYDPSDGMFYDVSISDPFKWGQNDTGTNLSDFPTLSNMQTEYWYRNADLLIFQLDNPFYVAPPPPEPVARIEATGGDWSGTYYYSYYETTLEGRYLYELVDIATDNAASNSNGYAVGYDPSDGMFHDVGTSNPYKWDQDNTGTNLSSFPTLSNMQTHYWYDSGTSLKIQFHNPYYVEPPPEPDESKKRLVATGGQYNGTFEYLYFSTTPENNFVYGLVETDSSERYSPTNYDFEYNPSDGKFYDSGSSHPAKWGTDANGTSLSEFPTTANMETLFWYNESGDTLIFQFNSPFYVAPPEPVVEPVDR